MIDLSDAFIALPGGCGTLDEYFEVFTWAQIGLHHNPVILYNVDGFYDAIIQHFDKMIEEGFIREEQRDILKVASTPGEVVTILTSHQNILLKKVAEAKTLSKGKAILRVF